ncbi:hypothetical protein [Streptomyces sp. NPDC002402]
MDGPQDATWVWAQALCKLWEAAGKPPGKVIQRQCHAQDPPIEVPSSSWSDWRNGKRVPSDPRTARVLVTVLKSLARRTTPSFVPCDEAWWEQAWRRARDERRAGSRKGGRPRKQLPVGMPTAGERTGSPELVADKVRDALVQVETRVRVILGSANSAIELLKEKDSDSLGVVEIRPVVEILDPLLGEVHEAHVYKWRTFKSLELKAKMGELYWPEPDRIDHAEQSFRDLHQGILALLMSLQPVSGAPRSRTEIQHLLSNLCSVAFHLILDLGEFSVDLNTNMNADDEE